MNEYANPQSGITAFRIGPDYIRVRFGSDTVYTYDYDSTGKLRIERMKQLARQGRGLNTYISQVVRDAYAGKAGVRAADRDE
jgi:hypothetical protein